MSKAGFWSKHERYKRTHPHASSGGPRRGWKTEAVQLQAKRPVCWKAITCVNGHLYYAATKQRRCWVCRAPVLEARAMDVMP